jgi:hypothetical protein
VEQVRRGRKLEGLDVRQPGEQEVASLAEHRNAVFPGDDERRLGDASRFVVAERPLCHRGQFLAEERVGVGHGLVDRTGERLLERGAVVGSADAAHPGVDGSRLVACAVALERGLDDRVDHLHVDGAGGCGPRRVQQGQGVHGVGGVQCQLERHARAGGVADDVRALDPEAAHQRAAVLRLLGEAERIRQAVAAGIAAAVVAEHGVAAGKSALFDQRPEEVGADAGVDEHDRLAGAADLVLELDAVNRCPLHLPHSSRVELTLGRSCRDVTRLYAWRHSISTADAPALPLRTTGGSAPRAGHAGSRAAA